MELTEKCKKDFELWYLSNKTLTTMSGEEFVHIWSLTRSNSEKWGVYIDFFDTVDIPIEDTVGFEPTMQGFKVKFYNYFIKGKESKRRFTCRIDSRTDAIRQSNELYNKSK